MTLFSFRGISLWSVSGEGLQFLRPVSRLGIIAVLFLFFVVLVGLWWSDRRLREELSRGRRTVLVLLRFAVFVGLAVLVAEPVWMHQVHKSRVVLLLDTSGSMALSRSVSDKSTRGEAVLSLLRDSRLVPDLAGRHQVVLASFDSQRTVLNESPAAGEPLPPDSLAVENLPPFKGTETRLAAAVSETIRSEENLAGIVLLSDGQSRPEEPVSALPSDSTVPILCLGTGPRLSDYPPALEVVDAVAADWIPCGDELDIRLRLRRTGVSPDSEQDSEQDREQDRGTLFEPHVRAWLVPDSGTSATPDELVAQMDKEPAVESGSTPVPGHADQAECQLGMTGEKAGRYWLVLEAAFESLTPARLARPVQVLDRREKVLVLAGGPVRDLQFIQSASRWRPSLDMDVVWLDAENETGETATSTGIPLPAPDALNGYDVVVAFDPDWRKLTTTWIQALEHWVVDGGGFIPVAGPIAAGAKGDCWMDDPSLELVRALYPVLFRKGPSGEGRLLRGKEPWTFHAISPDSLTELLPESGDESEPVLFPEARTCLAVEKVKPAATLLALGVSPESRSDPNASGLPVLFARERYGKGNVFYIGSPELWRLRERSEPSLHRFYLALFRQVMQGRIQPEEEDTNESADGGERLDRTQNDLFLNQLARQSGGRYLDLNDSATMSALGETVEDLFPVFAEEIEYDRSGQQRFLAGLIFLFLLALLTEWWLRRQWQLL